MGSLQIRARPYTHMAAEGTCELSASLCVCLNMMEENALAALVLCLLVVVKHYLRRRVDIRTKQDDGNPWTNQVSGQENTLEGCKSLHFQQQCRLPAKPGQPAIQAEEKRPAAAGRRYEMNKAAVQGFDAEEGRRTKLNIRKEAEDMESKRRKSRKYTMLGNSTFYHA